jgi:hypothetical protein
MKTAYACLLTAACLLSVAAAWPSPLAIDAAGDNKYVFFGRQGQHVMLSVEHGSAVVAARSSEGIFQFALIAEADGGSRLQVRDENGGAIQIDLLKAARILKSLGAGE